MKSNQSSPSLQSIVYFIAVLGVLVVRDQHILLSRDSSSAVFSGGVSAQQEQEQQYESSSSSSSSLSSSLLSSWQSCSTFLTPSIDGWAVYAGRDFKVDELVELTPFFIPLESHRTKHSVLDDYVFSFPRKKRTTINSDSDESNSSNNNGSSFQYNVVLLGNGAFYNHHREPNLKYVQIVQREDGNDHKVDVPHLVGFRATRYIFAGEQLYISYGDHNYNTNNMEWFERRGLDEQKTRTEDSIESYMLPFYLSKHCSKIYAGVGLPTWRDNILPILSSKRNARLGNNNNAAAVAGDPIVLDPTHWMDLSRLAPFDAGLSEVRAKVTIKKGEHIEKSLALVLSRNQVRNTSLGPIAFYWENLKIDHHQHLINLRDDEKLILQYQGSDTDWESVDRFIAYSEITILPVSGNIGLVRRVGGAGDGHHEEYNCKLMIRSNTNHQAINKVGVTLELIATRDIPARDILKLNIAPSEFKEEYRLLHDEMEQSGQPHHPGSIFDSIKDDEAEEL